MEHKKKSVFTVFTLSNFAYLVAAIVLYIFALWIVVAAVFKIILKVNDATFHVHHLLDEIGLIVFSIAVIDLCRYLMIEEVLKGGEKKNFPAESRRTFTKFVMIIITALSLEGLVLTIEIANSEGSIAEIIYPIFLFLTATFLMMGLGYYQKTNARAEEIKRIDS